MTNNETGKLWSGVMFIILGIIFLLQEFFSALNFEDFWPVLLIITGIIIMYDGYKKLKTVAKKQFG